MKAGAEKQPDEPSLLISVLFFVGVVFLMAALRFHLFPNRLIALSYTLPLLFCLWHRDRRLLWSLVVAFIGMSAYKAFVWMPTVGPNVDHEMTQWLFQVCNILSGGIAVHLTISFARRLNEKHVQLTRAHEELGARAAEIEQQNEDLNQQAEELTAQNEEIRAQGEELERQNEELSQRTEELTASKGHAAQREAMLQALLNSLREPGETSSLLEAICDAAHKLLGESVSGVAIIERRDNQLSVQAKCGVAPLASGTWPYASSFAEVVIGQGRTAFVADLAARPDLTTARSHGVEFRSVLGTPLMVGGAPVGAVEAFSLAPRQWTADDFAALEWVAAEVGLILEARASQERLELLVRERTAQLQEMVQELQHFSYTITHDMRAPLRSLQGFASILLEDDKTLSDELRSQYLGRIVTSAARMDQLILDALNYARAVQQQLPLEQVDPAQLLRGILDSYPSLQPPKAEVRIEGPLPIVLANEAGLTQCFANLLTNAVKFVAPGEKAHVRIYAEAANNSHARICVEDNGIGISEQMRPKLFQMFQRERREYEGTGIGLALVRKVTERMGGAVGCESQLGKGSRFWLDLQLPPASTSSRKKPVFSF